MKPDNPFARLGALDQQLYQETSPKDTENETDKINEEKARNTANPQEMNDYDVVAKALLEYFERNT